MGLRAALLCMTDVVSVCCSLKPPVAPTCQQQHVESPAILTTSADWVSSAVMLVMALTVLEWPLPGGIMWSSS